MTVIAWDGTTLAADKRSVSSGLASTVTKILKINGSLIGASGDFDECKKLEKWFKSGDLSEEAYPKGLKGDTTLLVISPTGQIRLHRDSYLFMTFEDSYCAIGCGRDYALSALSLGMTAAEAVAHACKFDVYCGNGIDTLTLG